ncbi:MAG TPA: TetR/AcrR family transcriptional regulator [Desulfobulbus sp.]|nr:TetR/AcrR family transcriptional regulator [Desulfobulbus sp.]
MTAKQKISHRQLQKEDTRRIILNSAYVLFAKNGYTKTTMRSLAEQAGVAMGTIFKHFPDKPSLLAAAFQDDLSKIIQNSFNSLPESGLKNQLLHITKCLYTFYAENHSLSRTLIKEVLFLEGEHGEILDAQIVEFLEKISVLVKNAIENGELNKKINIHDGALAFWSFYFTVLLMGLKRPSFDINIQLNIIGTLIENHFY